MSLPHGGNIYHYARKYGISPSDVLDFSASINPLGPSPKSVAAMAAAVPSLVNYPDPESSLLVSALSVKLGVGETSILPANGSTELIYLIPRVLRPKKALVLAPSFSDYSRALKLSGCKVNHFTLREEDGFRPDIDRLVKAVRGVDMALICNPNNPSGVLLDRGEMAHLIRQADINGTILVVDEAFIEYAPEASVVSDAAAARNVIILRNFTKFYGMPGLRAGYAVGNPKILKRLRAVKEPWSVNTLAEHAAAAALTDLEYEEKSLGLVAEEREKLSAALSVIPALKVFPSAANFLLVKIEDGKADADALSEETAKRGVLIRSCSNFPCLDERFFRVAIRTGEKNLRLVGIIAEILIGDSFIIKQD